MTRAFYTAAALMAALASAPAALAAEATAAIRAPDGSQLGTARMTDTPAGLLIHVRIAGLPPGERGFHVHETGLCNPPFESAGAHLAPGATRHGFHDDAGPHGGDLVNLVVSESGRVDTVVRAPALRLSQVLDADGAALVIHAGPDDYASQPAGGSGDRIACGVVMAADTATKP